MVCFCFTLGSVACCILAIPTFGLMGSSGGGVWPLYWVIFITPSTSSSQSNSKVYDFVRKLLWLDYLRFLISPDSLKQMCCLSQQNLGGENDD
ncbi:hypothetical protein J1N35_031224 [Gossypium stocksii]|uniref:Secreted protein n=1 Tax=Gossypium stocksii TaxID=47602 RepID=A0A9D3V1Z7_9ROSI|nr:hypothetical protein J1N35_031224 [Gossypium stocksii]